LALALASASATLEDAEEWANAEKSGSTIGFRNWTNLVGSLSVKGAAIVDNVATSSAS